MAPQSALWVDQDKLRQQAQLTELVQAIRAHNCCAFVGAGLSIPAGYPSWESLIEDLARAGGISVSHEDIRSGGEAALRIAGQCRARMSTRAYHQFLAEQFDPAGKERYRPIHLDLLEIGFNAFLTTNYDPCLQNASERVNDVPRVQVYPDLEASQLRNRHIYHIHGRAYDEHGHSEVETIVLTDVDYLNAYRWRADGDHEAALHTHSPLRALLRDVLLFQRLLFVGFSLTDPALLQLFSVSAEERRRLTQQTPRVNSAGVAQTRHFALLPIKVERTDGQLQHSEAARDRGQEEQQELSLRDLGVEVIRYPGDDELHTELEKVVRQLPGGVRQPATTYHPLVEANGGSR